MSYPYLIKPRRYQTDVAKKIYRHKRLALFWDMGTGKSKAAIDFFANMVHHGKLSRAIIVAPLTILDNWAEEIDKNAPWLTYSFLTADQEPVWNSNIILTNYDYFKSRRKKKRYKDGRLDPKTGKPKKREYVDNSRVKKLCRWMPHLVVLDESHKIKSRVTKAAKGAHILGRHCEYALCLTGTPIGNRPLDLWSQFKFLKPDLLDEKYDSFRDKYAIRGGFGGFRVLGFRNLDKLAEIISPYVSRQEMTGLHGKQFIPFPVKMPEEAMKLYKQMEQELIISLQGKDIIAPIALAKLTKLSQISSGYIKSNDGENIAIHRAKLDALAELVEDLHESNVTRVVIFARFKWELDQIHATLNNYNTYEISGRISRNDRKIARARFAEIGGILLCQIATGSAGINLQSANYTIYFSVDYSHINFSQSQDRTHRMGQDKPCFYYLMRCVGTIDTKIYQILRDKKDVSDEVFNLIEEMQRGNN